MRSKYCFSGLKTCLQPSFVLKVGTFVLQPNTLKTCLHYMLCGYKKESGEPSGSSVLFFKKWICHSLDGFSSSKIARFFCCRPFGLFLPSLFGNETLTSLPKRVKRYIHNKYSYPSAVRRSINTSSISLTILVNESCLQQHS